MLRFVLNSGEERSFWLRTEVGGAVVLFSVPSCCVWCLHAVSRASDCAQKLVPPTFGFGAVVWFLELLTVDSQVHTQVRNLSVAMTSQARFSALLLTLCHVLPTQSLYFVE